MEKPDERFFEIARENDQAALIVFARKNGMEIVNDLPGDTRIAGHGLVIDAGRYPAMWIAPRGRGWSRVLLDGSGIEVQNRKGEWEVVPFSDIHIGDIATVGGVPVEKVAAATWTQVLCRGLDSLK